MTSSHRSGDAVRALLKAAYDRDFEQAASFASPDIEVVDEPIGYRFVGYEGLRQFVQYWLDTFHDSQFDITDLVADDVGVAIEYVFHAWRAAPSSASAKETTSGTHSIQSRGSAFFQMAAGNVIGYQPYYNPPEQFTSRKPLPI
jgi:ketosteroid isomerase-like protein